MWSSSGGPALPCRRHDTLPAAPDWDSLLPLLPESVRLLRLVLEDDAALHALLRRCGGLTLRIPRRFPAEGHPLRALLPGPALRRLLAAYGGTCLYIPRCARLPPGTPAGAARRLQPPYGRRDLQQCRGALPGPPLRHHGPARLAAAQAGGGTAGRSPRGTRRPPPELIPDLPFRPDGKGCGLSRFFVRGLPRAVDSPPGRRDIPAIRHRIPSCASPPSASSAPQAAHRRPFLMFFLSGSLSPAC